jgi:hypothetical protein
MEQQALDLEVTQTQTESTTVVETPQVEKTLDELIVERTGEHEFYISYSDLKYIKNALTQKLEWTGSNEAYLLIITTLSIDSELERLDPKSVERKKVSLSATALESINYFINKISGKGIDSAQKLFSAAMQLRPALEKLKSLDEKIQLLKKVNK